MQALGGARGQALGCTGMVGGRPGSRRASGVGKGGRGHGVGVRSLNFTTTSFTAAAWPALAFGGMNLRRPLNKILDI